jgi:hypothetical protein
MFYFYRISNLYFCQVLLTAAVPKVIASSRKDNLFDPHLWHVNHRHLLILPCAQSLNEKVEKDLFVLDTGYYVNLERHIYLWSVISVC